MSKKLILTGRVQSVGCRQYCSSYAKDLGIRGSATNKSDGSVSVLLDTDSEELVSAFKNALLSNPNGYLFFGNIRDIKTEDYHGQITGDYVF